MITTFLFGCVSDNSEEQTDAFCMQNGNNRFVLSNSRSVVTIPKNKTNKQKKKKRN